MKKKLKKYQVGTEGNTDLLNIAAAIKKAKEQGWNIDGDNMFRKNVITDGVNQTFNPMFQKFNGALDLTQLIANGVGDLHTNSDEKRRLEEARYKSSRYNVDETGVNNLPVYLKTGGKLSYFPYGGGPLTVEGAKEILRDGTAHGRPLTERQKRYFGYIAGGGTPKKQQGGNLTPNQFRAAYMQYSDSLENNVHPNELKTGPNSFIKLTPTDKAKLEKRYNDRTSNNFFMSFLNSLSAAVQNPEDLVYGLKTAGSPHYIPKQQGGGGKPHKQAGGTFKVLNKDIHVDPHYSNDIYKATQEAKIFMQSKGMANWEDAYTTDVPQYIDSATGKPNVPIKTKPLPTSIPSYIQDSDIHSDGSLYWYVDPYTGDVHDFNNKVRRPQLNKDIAVHQTGGVINTTGYLKGKATNKNPMNIIPSGNITTENMAFPILANGVPLYPNTGEYNFNSKYVVEKPMRRMMKKGGKLIMCQDGGEVEEVGSGYSIGDVVDLTEKQINDLKSKGYKLEYL